jgi:hypothetical protein
VEFSCEHGNGGKFMSSCTIGSFSRRAHFTSAKDTGLGEWPSEHCFHRELSVECVVFHATA